MSRSGNQDDADWLEQLAGRALGDLSTGEWDAVEATLREQGELSLAAEELERTAVAVAMVFDSQQKAEPLPDKLHKKLIFDADRYFANQSMEPSSPASNLEHDVVQARGEETLNRREAFAWLGLAAALLLAVTLWVSSPSDVVRTASVEQQRERLIEEADDVLQVSWTAGKTPFQEDVSGDVLWSNAKQAGFMRFKGMPVNDPSVEQYQLWIVDPKRDEQPIDGGVFDIGSSGEVVIPIDSKLRVIAPDAFAVTIEQPGGVVVSSQERLPLLAVVQ